MASAPLDPLPGVSDNEFDRLLRDLDDLPPPNGARGPLSESPEETPAILLPRLQDASKKLVAIAELLDPTPDKHPLHNIALSPEAKRPLQELVTKLLSVQAKLEDLEHAAAGEPTPAPVPTETRDPERTAFELYKTQWDAAFTQDSTLKEKHPEVLAYYEQMEKYFREKGVWGR